MGASGTHYKVNRPCRPHPGEGACIVKYVLIRKLLQNKSLHWESHFSALTNGPQSSGALCFKCCSILLLCCLNAALLFSWSLLHLVKTACLSALCLVVKRSHSYVVLEFFCQGHQVTTSFHFCFLRHLNFNSYWENTQIPRVPTTHSAFRSLCEDGLK